MQTSTEKIIDAGFKNRILTETDLLHLLNGTNSQRYALVNKSLRHEELIQIRRGLYTLAQKYRDEKPSLYTLANYIVPFSYVSLECALAYHGWIPEKVVSIINVIPSGHSRTFETPFGDFEYYRIPTKPLLFLNGVLRINHTHQAFLLASPLRALADYFYLRTPSYDKLLHYLEKSLRIELSKIRAICADEINPLIETFRSKRVIDFLNDLKKELLI